MRSYAAIGVGVHPGGLAVGLGSVWVTDADSPRLLRIDPRYGSVDPIELPGKSGAGGVSVGEGSVWIAQGGSRVLRIDPETGRVERRWRVPSASDVHLADGKAWLVSGGRGNRLAGGPCDQPDHRLSGAAARPLLHGGRWRVRLDGERLRPDGLEVLRSGQPLDTGGQREARGERRGARLRQRRPLGYHGRRGNGHSHRPPHERQEDIRRRPRNTGDRGGRRSPRGGRGSQRRRGNCGTRRARSRTSSPPGTRWPTPIRRSRRARGSGSSSTRPARS